MIFSSLLFLYVFLPVCLLLHTCFHSIKAKNLALLIVSLIFYAWGEPLWVFLMIATGIINWIFGIQIERSRKRVLMIFAIIVDLSFLCIFKYSDFFINNLNLAFGLHIPLTGISLPIGISFYTFQTISYIVDVYRGETKAQKSLVDLLLFITLFPQLIAGPILRYSDIAAQIKKRIVTAKLFSSGITKFLSGLAKKVLIANVVGSIASDMLASPNSVFAAWFGIFLFALQIYFDFSGYSDMAIGLGRMFGFNYGENFNYPYISHSITEFWRRWHISLSSIFKDYVYIPLGGNQHHQIRNMLIVWLLTGFWHGASWNFVVWGFYFFIWLVLEKKFLGSYLQKLPVLSNIYAMLVVLIGWVFFYNESLKDGFNALKLMFGLSGAPVFDVEAGLAFYTNLPLLIIAIIACTPIASYVRERILKMFRGGGHSRKKAFAFTLAYNIITLFICTASLVGSSYNPFLYFRF